MLYTKLSPLGIRLGDSEGLSGRVKAARDSQVPIHFSNDPVNDPLEINGSTYNGPYYPATFHTEAKYFINLADHKGHSLTGVTLCAKNIFGAIWNPLTGGGTEGWSPGDYGLHPFIKTMSISTLVSNKPERVYGQYNALVDLMGHDEFGGKCILYMFYALYSANGFDTIPSKWQMFGDDWVSSIFVSQDPVALDSVGVDFLHGEPTITYDKGDLDNYLHEAAQADNPPSGTFYDPNNQGDVVRLPSLGVHEHWNNATDKQYSRNLGIGLGIELLQVRTDGVVGRHTFYNDSSWDGNDPAAGGLVSQ